MEPDKNHQSVVEFLSHLDFFRNLPATALDDLAHLMHLRVLGGGETLIKQGDVDESLYILWHGQLRVFISREGKEGVVGQVFTGEIVGEIALLVHEPRKATVRAVRDSIILQLDKSSFDSLVEKYPKAMMDIARLCVRKLVGKTSPSIHPCKTIALIPVGKSLSANKSFMGDFLQTFQHIAHILYLSSDTCNQFFEREIAQTPLDGSDNHRLTTWLNQQEKFYDYIIYESDPTLTNWTQRSLRQADRIFLLIEANEDPSLGEIENLLFQNLAKYALCMELIILQKKTNPILNTRDLLVLRNFIPHQHVRLHSPQSMDRFVRYLTGRSIGLVLSGGGSRSSAYIGLIRALEELQIPIDLIGGCSGGSVIAACFALGLSYYEIAKVIDDFVHHLKFDYTFPLISAFKGKNFTDLLKLCVGEETLIEDLSTTFFCVSTNINSYRMHVHEHDSLWRAIRASSSIPGILPPVAEKGAMLVDGGVINNMPVDVMRGKIRDGKIFAVDCSAMPTQKNRYPFEEPWVSGWKQLFRRFNPFESTAAEFPYIFQILHSTIELGSAEHNARMAQEADYFLGLDTHQLTLLDYSLHSELIELGYQASFDYLSKLLDSQSFAFQKPY